jgi:hypothetical protein
VYKTHRKRKSHIPLLGIYLRECKSGYNKSICIPIFTAALFTIARL